MSSTAPDMDLGTEEGVRSYLAGTEWAGAEVIPLSGGNTNFVYRLRPIVPYRGNATVVLKHAKSYVKFFENIKIGIERQKYEVEALRRVHGWLPGDAFVTVPEVFLFDEVAHVIIMEDAGPECTTLKAFMQTGKVSLSQAQKIGASIGAFLGSLHKWGADNKELLEVVKEHRQAVTLTAWVTYGQLVSTLTGQDPVPKLKDPPLDLVKDDIDAVARVGLAMTQACLNASDTFSMGDFWPGNMMVRIDAQGDVERIYVGDWEVAKVGLPGMDVGQFAAEIHLLRRCNPETCNETASILLENFLKEYKVVCGSLPEVAKDAIVYWGTHMVVWVPRVHWGGKEITRAVVLEGVGLLLDGWHNGEEWVRNSLVRDML